MRIPKKLLFLFVSGNFMSHSVKVASIEYLDINIKGKREFCIMLFRLELIKKPKSFSQTHLLPFSCKYEGINQLLLNTNTQTCIDSKNSCKEIYYFNKYCKMYFQYSGVIQ